MMDYPSVSIIVPAFNEELYIRDCLKSLINLNYPPDKMEIIMVDNGSTDSTLAIAREYNIKILEKPLVKVGAVRNFGALSSKNEIIAFVDGDCVVKGSWLKEGVEAITTGDNCVLGGQYLIREDASWLERYWILNDADSVHQTTLVGGAIFIRRIDFNVIEGFDENLGAGEDSDLTERLRAAGYEVEISPSLSVVHLGYPSTIRSFIKRQIWHSSEYVDQIPHSFKDKVFLLTLIFIFGNASLLLYLFSSMYVFLLPGMLVVVTPLILSIKRIIRSGGREYSIKDLIMIYFVDFLYLIGRSLGVIKGGVLKASSLFIQKS